ncbi:MAG: hypothetical protein JO182_08135 [Acidobacteriaceae bacterium]|nr:hypothetical protein [Acidobacteriaceae bacterium]
MRLSTPHNAALHISHKMWSSTSYDGNGFWLCLRRFSSGKLLWWPVAEGTPLRPLAAPHLMVLLYQGHPEQACFTPRWRALS